MRPAATGSATPTRTLTSASLTAPATAIAVDATGEIYALSGNSVLVFAASATGTSTPVRLISGAHTLLNSPSSIAVDSAQNIYVANNAGNNVLVFSSTATGNVAPASILCRHNNPDQRAAGRGARLRRRHLCGLVQPAEQLLAGAGVRARRRPAMPPLPARSPPSPPIPSPAWRSTALDNLYVFTQAPTTNLLAIDIFTPDESGSAAPVESITATSWTASNYGQIAVR